jgi:hypothetical protein
MKGDDMTAFAIVVKAEREFHFPITEINDQITSAIGLCARGEENFAVTSLPVPLVVLKHLSVQSTALLTRSHTADTSFTTSKTRASISRARRVNLDIFLITRLLSLLANYDPVNTEPSTETVIPMASYDTQGS